MIKRESQIVDLLLKHGELSVGELSDLLNTSPSSIRRDLSDMDENHFINRTHGGVSLATTINYLPRYLHRLQIDPIELRAIARRAAEMVHPGDIIGVSGGEVCTQLSFHLRLLQDVTVVTNAINVAAEFASLPGIQVRMTGGSLNAGSFELVGQAIGASLNGVHINKFFLGTDGISVQFGVTGHDEAEAMAARDIMTRADITYVLADSQKFNRGSFTQVAPVSAFEAVITTSRSPQGAIAELESAGLKSIIVPV
jgi:DeoR family transcriptional regulator, aga operon transcriptional repressor